jgi:predicted lipoprotein with Yx(FWY)xxD motif
MTSLSLTRRRSFGVMLGGAAAALVVAGCGGSSGGSTGGLAAGGSAQSTVTTHAGNAGRYLTDGAGRALYVFSADKGMASACKGGCTQEWPAFMATGAPKATGSVAAGKLGATGAHQVTYAGHPLYYFAGDATAGQTNGQGLSDFGGTWTLVTTSGAAVAAAPGSSSGGSGGSYGGYGG